MDTVESYHSDVDICNQISCMHIDFYFDCITRQKRWYKTNVCVMSFKDEYSPFASSICILGSAFD
jgi:hypothetical protein